MTVKAQQILTRNIARNYVSKDPVLSDQYLLISAGAFSGQNKIVTIAFPKHLVSIKNKGFYSCQYLSEVQLPHSVSEVGTEAFGECHRLRKVYISIAWNTFQTTVSEGIKNYIQFCLHLIVYLLPLEQRHSANVLL